MLGHVLNLLLFAALMVGGAWGADALIGITLPGDACFDMLTVATVALLVVCLILGMLYLGVVVIAAIAEAWPAWIRGRGWMHAIGAATLCFSGLTPVIVLHGPTSGPAYGGRVAVVEGLGRSSTLQQAVEEYWRQHRQFPLNLEDLRLPPAPQTEAVAVAGIELGQRGVITIRFASASRRFAPLDDTSLVLTPTPAGAELTWDCRGGDLPDAMRPAACRQTGVCGGGDGRLRAFGSLN